LSFKFGCASAQDGGRAVFEVTCYICQTNKRMAAELAVVILQIQLHFSSGRVRAVFEAE